MNLIIDQGNTYCKLAIFDQDDMVEYIRVKNCHLNSVEATLKDHNINKAIISSVSDYTLLEKLLLNMNVNVMLLSHSSIFPIGIQYETPETLGLDRIAAAVGAWKLSPNTINLIVDIGTAITYDIATPNQGFIGGNIAPGLDMRLSAMHQQTRNLPLLKRKESKQSFGRNTFEAMQNGAEMGIIAEINAYISTGKNEYGEISTFLTGGDATYFEKKIKNGIFVVPTLILVGLLEILKIN